MVIAKHANIVLIHYLLLSLPLLSALCSLVYLVYIYRPPFLPYDDDAGRVGALRDFDV
jgi:hypothetical protein